MSILILFLLTMSNGCMASLSSRSRNRNNMTYHMCVQLISHTIWLLVLNALLRELMNNPLTIPVVCAYVSGYTTGSLLGAKVSMRIERLIGAKADE